MATSELSGLSDGDLEKRLGEAEKEFDRIYRLDPARIVREGKQDEVLVRMGRALATIKESRIELDSRAASRATEKQQTGVLARLQRDLRWREGEYPAFQPLQFVARSLDPWELQGSALDGRRLTEAETAELKTLVERIKDGIRDETKKPLTAKERSRFERLVGIAAGDPKIYERKRKKAELQETLRAIKEEQRVMSLPKRPIYEEPGSITLPRYAFSWLETSTDGAWTVADVGMLVALLGMWENKSCALIPGSTFVETADGELELVVPGGGANAFRLRNGANGNPMVLDSGYVRESAALQTLAGSGWLDGTVEGLEIRIRLGEKAKKLREERKARAAARDRVDSAESVRARAWL